MNVLQRVAGALIGIALFIAAFVFASVIFAVAAVLALIIWGWLMWRTRDLRRDLKRAEGAAGTEGTVIEGEYRVERETHRIDDGG